VADQLADPRQFGTRVRPWSVSASRDRRRATTPPGGSRGGELPERRKCPRPVDRTRAAVHRDGHAKSLRDLLLRRSPTCRASGMRRDAPVALTGHGDRKRDQFLGLHIESAGSEGGRLKPAVGLVDLRNGTAQGALGLLQLPLDAAPMCHVDQLYADPPDRARLARPPAPLTVRLRAVGSPKPSKRMVRCREVSARRSDVCTAVSSTWKKSDFIR
jgi:hypothetical protein